MGWMEVPDADGNRYGRQVEKPGSCPICHAKIADPTIVGDPQRVTPDDRGITIEIAFQCPFDGCKRIFICRYAGYGEIVELLPRTAEPIHVPEEVEEVCPSFRLIYSQAAQAETDGLDEIVGPAYRKALEFLIREYCLSLPAADEKETPEEKEKRELQIRKALLGTVIDLYLPETVKEIAARATWLGNDNTHFERKWPEKTLDDCKLLIRLTVASIGERILVDKARRSMQPRK